jgi:hypothetical protein
MDVQADEASVGSDPSQTLAVGVPVKPAAGAARPVHQGTFFPDEPYATYADTDRTPAVPAVSAAPARPAPVRPRRAPPASRGLRFAVVVVALAVAAAAATLALVETGVIKTKSGTGPRTAAPPPATHTHPPATPTTPKTPKTPKQTLLTPGGFGPQNAAYTVNAPAYGLTITTSTGRAWVSVGVVGQKPIFAGIVPANSSQHVTLLGPAQLEIGAGGTTVTVTSDRRSQTLTPSVAPFTYQFTPS